MSAPAVQRYRNLSGYSGVLAYKLGARSIVVRFADGDEHRDYTYSWTRPGREHVEAMKELAQAGRGLATYISQQVGDAYASRR